MNDLKKSDRDPETESWKHLVDKIVDFISTSKSTLRLVNEEHSITDGKKPEAANQNAKEVVKSKLLKELLIEFLKGDSYKNDKTTQIHINESYNESESEVSCSTLYNEGQYKKRKNSHKQSHNSMNFLDEQYNLTKQAIARRYRPQIKVNSVSSKGNMMKDYLNQPFNHDWQRVSNVASETISVKRIKKKHSKKTEKVKRPSVEKTSNKETFTLYEKSKRTTDI